MQILYLMKRDAEWHSIGALYGLRKRQIALYSDFNIASAWYAKYRCFWNASIEQCSSRHCHRQVNKVSAGLDDLREDRKGEMEERKRIVPSRGTYHNINRQPPRSAAWYNPQALCIKSNFWIVKNMLHALKNLVWQINAAVCRFNVRVYCCKAAWRQVV